MENNNNNVSETLHSFSVSNAGLVLLGPFFQRLFSVLGLLNENTREFRNTDASVRAVFILQRLVSPNTNIEYKDSDLVLNRVLTGCSFSTPLPNRLDLTLREIELVENVLSAVIKHWGQSFSVQTFQQTFIEHNGSLGQLKNGWKLSVQVKAYDVLLESLPWPYSRIVLPWIKEVIQVEWAL